MPWRLIGFILIFVIFLVFIAFNLENKCNLSFGFTSYESVPVYLTAFSSFALGMLSAIPFMISFGFKKGRERKKRTDGGSGRKRSKKEEIPDVSPEAGPDVTGKGGPYGID